MQNTTATTARFKIPPPPAIIELLAREERLYTQLLRLGDHSLEIRSNSDRFMQKTASHFHAMQAVADGGTEQSPKVINVLCLDSSHQLADMVQPTEFIPLHEENRQDWTGGFGRYSIFYQLPDLLSFWQEGGAESYLIFGRIGREDDFATNRHQLLHAGGDDFLDSYFPMICDHIYLLIAQFLGAVCFHGACVEVNGKVLLLTGESGAGKSTTALALFRDGAHFFTDEIVLLCSQHSTITILGIPIQPYLAGAYPTGLASLERTLGVSNRKKSPVKMDSRRSMEMAVSGRRLDAVLFLEAQAERPATHELIPMGDMETFDLLNSQILGYNIPQSAKKRMQYLLELVSTCPAYRFRPGTSLATIFSYLDKGLCV